MKSSNSDFEMSILVGHKPISEYFHEDMWFVEGRHGSEYSIRIRNNTYRRACFVVSVDGLSVLDGKDASDNSPGYVLNPHDTLDIACYKVDDGTGAKFVFGCKERSYTAEMGNGTENTGVIAVKAYREKYAPPPVPYGAWYGSGMRSYSGSVGASLSSKSSSGSGHWGSNSAEAVYPLSSGDNAYRGIAPSSAEPKAESVEQQLGTVFGESMKWETTTVMFAREAMGSEMVVYYDTKKNLERRGIRLEKKTKPLPNPFPGNKGCAPPPQWRK